MWKNPFKWRRKSHKLTGHQSGMFPLRAPTRTGDMQRRPILASFNSVSWYWARSFLWWGQTHGSAVPSSCWPSFAPAVAPPWSLSPGAAPTQSEWMNWRCTLCCSFGAFFNWLRSENKHCMHVVGCLVFILWIYVNICISVDWSVITAVICLVPLCKQIPSATTFLVSFLVF